MGSKKTANQTESPQKIVAFQQNGSGERKIPVQEALVRIGQDVQYYCTAEPAGWDPVHGRSPVHLAGKIHQKALATALKP